MNPFYKSYNYFINKKFLLLSLLIILVSTLLFFSSQLNLEEDITKLIPQTEKTKTLNKVLKNTDFSDKIIVNIAVKKNGTADNLISYASEIIDSLQTECSEYIINIQGQIPDDDIVNTLDFIYANLPLFLEESDYKYIEQKLSKDSLTDIVQSNYKTLVSPSGLIAKQTIRKDPFGLSFRALKKLEDLKISDSFDIYKGFLVTKNKQNLLLFIKPALPTNDTDANKLFVEKLHAIANNINQKYKDTASSEYYGSTVIAASNANQIKTDIKYTVSIALTILLLILIFFYKRILVPILLFVPTLLGALVAIVSLHFIRDSISAISLGIGSILLGITLDYSLHILTHYRHNNDVKQLYKDVTKPILMSSITTATAFLCLLLLKSQALQDLGVFAAISVIATSLFALLIIPLLYRPKVEINKTKSNIIEKVARYRYDKNKFLIVASILLLIVSFYTSKNVTFNKDLNSMNYQSEATLTAERNLDSILKLSSKSIYIVAYGDDLQTVLEANTTISKSLKKAEVSNDILQFSSNGAIVLSASNQQAKIDRWNTFWNDNLKQQVKSDFVELGASVEFKESTYRPFYDLLDKDFTAIDLSEYKGVKSLMTQEYISDTTSLKTAVSIVKIDEVNKAKLESLVADIPNAILIDRKHVSETFLGGLKDNFSSLINYSFIAIFIIILLFFKNIELTLLTTIPIAVTWFLTLGVMGIIGIEFTIFNVIISTFIFGLGVDYSIFITNGLVKDYTYGTKELSTYKVSIILSVITTILGVGVLIFAKHPALRSISALCLIGILITAIVAFTIQPLLFRIFVKNRTKKGFAPHKFRVLIHSILLQSFYGLGGMLLSLFSITMLKIIPISKKKKFKWIHKAAAKLVTAVLYANPFIKKKVINEINETFEKPAIIISNHASSLDTLTMGLLTHNVIYLVNDWVYKSPVFGILARVLGFYPVKEGVDDSTEHLQEKVRQGYSLVVFPEAKRSLTNKIGRFHKGAFFLQEQLQLDILPIYFHGNSEVMPKNDMIIHDGKLTVKVGERIKYDDINFGESARERTKQISKLYKFEFLKFRTEIETEDYFKRILLSNYEFKNPNIQKVVKEDFKTNKSLYHLMNEHLPMKMKMLHIAGDYGQLDILLVAKSLERKITTFIADEEKRLIASNCYTNTHRKVKYPSSFEELNLEEFDTVLIEKKSDLIEKIKPFGFEIEKEFEKHIFLNRIN